MRQHHPPKKLLIAFADLRSSYEVYRNAHWQTRGPNYYGNHLLFQRLYEETAVEIDSFAEHLVGSWGSEVIESLEIPAPAGDPLGLSDKITQRVSRNIEAAYKELKRTKQMTLGWDDLLMTISNEKESHLYLLQQASYPRESNPAGTFLWGMVAGAAALGLLAAYFYSRRGEFQGVRYIIEPSVQKNYWVKMQDEHGHYGELYVYNAEGGYDDVEAVVKNYLVKDPVFHNKYEKIDMLKAANPKALKSRLLR